MSTVENQKTRDAVCER